MNIAERISGRQLVLLLFSFIAPTVVLVIPGLMYHYAKLDAWLTLVPALCAGTFTIACMTILSRRYPGMTIVRYGAEIVGLWPSRVLGAFYLFYWFNFCFIILNQHIQFINTVLLMRSPPLVISLTLAVLCAIAAGMGIEAIGRCNEYLAMLIFVLLLPLLLLMLEESDPGQLLPIMGDGTSPILRGSLYPSAYLSQFVILGWLLPYLNRPRRAAAYSMIALLTIAGLLLVTVIPLILIFGPLTDKLSFPLLSVIQYIGLEGSFERLEAIGVVIWVMGCFVKISLTLFIVCLTIRDLCRMDRYKDFIVPVTLVSVIGSVTIFVHYATDLNHYLRYTYPAFALFAHCVVPFVLLAIDSVRRGWRR